MISAVLRAPSAVAPFCEPARDLRIQNSPLWLWQKSVLAPYTDRTLEVPEGAELPEGREPIIAYRDNLFFDAAYVRAFIQEARRRGHPVRAAFSADDAAFREHALPLSVSYTRLDDLYLADLWYYPHGPAVETEPLVLDLLAREVGYYHIPMYVSQGRGDLLFHVPLRSLMAIDSWVHVILADVAFGVMARGARFEERLRHDVGFRFRALWRSLLEGRQVLESSSLVTVGRNCVIDPSAVIHGPTTIGDNVTIGAGAVIDNCIIGSNVNISQGVQLMLSVVGDGSFLPFRAGLFMSTVMDHSVVAQNTCMQLCVVGRNTFVGAGSTFTDLNLLAAPLRARDGLGTLGQLNRPLMGAAVGHNCRLGSGLVVYPARTIESDVVLTGPRVVDRDVGFGESDHHTLASGQRHQPLYHAASGQGPLSW